MPQIYTNSPSFTVTDGQVGTRSTTIGSLENIYDNNKFTFYQTNSSVDPLVFTITFTGDPQSIDSVYVLAQNIDSASFSSRPLATGLGTDVTGGLTFDNRRGIISTVASPVTGCTGVRLRLTRRSGASNVKIYQILAMRHLRDLTDNDTRTITRFETTQEIRNAYIQEDLYGTRTLQTGHLDNPRKNISYQIWKSASNLSAARNELSELYSIQRGNPNITVWDLDEDNARDYESVFPAFWVPGSFSSSIEASQAISYSFAIEEQ